MVFSPPTIQGVTPANAGAQPTMGDLRCRVGGAVGWIPAFAGMTDQKGRAHP